MKKNIVLFSLIILLFILSGCSQVQTESNSLGLVQLNYEDIADKLIRFHVIANSDSKEDQELKLKVRDEVIEALSAKLKDSKSLEEARILLEDNMDYVSSVAKKVIEENNYNYDIKTTLSKENFPDKIYGDYIFPQGNYEAFRVVIGDGSGQNWWCVMFPPLCFVDETKNVVNSEELDSSIEKLKLDKDDDGDDNANKDEEKEKDEESTSENKVVFKSKIVEFFKGVF